jgi:predicted dehydrogenase
MARPVGIGVIGCGSVSNYSYQPVVQRLNLSSHVADFVIACDVNIEAAKEAQRRFGHREVTTDYREVIAHPDVDLVLVLTAMQVHGEITMAALEAGKHVLVEKPMSMDLGEAKRILEFARTAPGKLICAPHVVLSPTYRDMWRRIHAGDIGEVHLARGLYGWSGPWWGEWFYQPGGGSMFDLGVYNVTTLTGLLGPAKRVVSMSGIAIPTRIVDGKEIEVRTDDNAHLLLDFGDACYASITTGFTIQAYKVPGIEIYGSKGTIQMIGEDWLPRGYHLWQNDAGCWQEYGSPHWVWTDGVRHMIECIQNDVDPIVTAEHAYHVLEIMLKSMQSGAEGKAFEIESTFTPPRFDTSDEGTIAAHLDHNPLVS